MNISINIEHVPEEEQFRLYQFLKNKFDVNSREEILNMNLSDFLAKGDICTKTHNLLRSAGLHTLLQVSQYPKSLLPRYRGIGKETMREIEDLLNRYGLEFFKEE